MDPQPTSDNTVKKSSAPQAPVDHFDVNGCHLCRAAVATSLLCHCHSCHHPDGHCCLHLVQRSSCFVFLFGSASFLPSFLEILCFFLGTSETAFADFETKSPSSVKQSCTFPLRTFSGWPSGAGALPGTLNFLKAADRLLATVDFPNVFIWL